MNDLRYYRTGIQFSRLRTLQIRFDPHMNVIKNKGDLRQTLAGVAAGAGAAAAAVAVVASGQIFSQTSANTLGIIS